MRKLLPYLIIGILITILFFKGCGDGKGGKKSDTIKIDTIFVEKTIPGDTITVVQTEFKPKIIFRHGDNSELVQKIQQLESDKERLEFLLTKLQTKVYDTTYAFERGSLSIIDTVQGSLLGRSWNLKLNPIKYQEKTIFQTETKYPKFSFSAGLNTGLTTDFSTQFKKPYIGLQIGFRNRSGYTLQLGFNSLEQAEITLSKDFITIF
ncbi:MAG TPA: hypothetical protein VFM82_09095 [Flavobacteriaceae bacterium]|nr:hypothetical protein [Flavobacteriaceae bacterium]